MGKALRIRDDWLAEALRRAARREKDGRAAAGMDAIEPRVEGLRRAEAARLAGMERQALRDAVVRTTNAEGLLGLHDRPKGRPRRRLDAKEEAALAAAIARGPDPDADGGSCLDAGRPVPLAGGRARQDLPPVEHDPGAAPARLLARDRRGPITPNGTQRRRRPSKRGARRAGGRHRGAPSRQADRAVVFPRGSGRHQGPGLPSLVAPQAERPPGVQQPGHLWASILTPIRPATGEDVTRVLPAVSTAASASSSSTMSPPPGRRTRISSWRSTAPAGMRAAPSSCRPASPSSSCRPRAPSSTRSSGSGSTCASASSRCASPTPPTPSSTPGSPRLDAPPRRTRSHQDPSQLPLDRKDRLVDPPPPLSTTVAFLIVDGERRPWSDAVVAIATMPRRRRGGRGRTG